MTQPPQGGPGMTSGHPEPDPVPDPEPEPPQPIPPPDPAPAPEPPHTAPGTPDAEPAPAARASPSPGDAIDGRPDGKPGDAIDGRPGETGGAEWPPIGAYPGEPGHPGRAPENEAEPATAEVPAASAAPGAGMADAVTAQTPAVSAAAATGPNEEQWQPTESFPVVPPPWHAQHELPGEWHTHPPEHLAWQHSPPPESGPEPPIWAGQPGPYPPWQVPLAPQQRPKRRTGLWVSLALTAILLLCGGGAVSAYFLISNADTGKGAPDPATAVNRFMTAVYTQQDPAGAEQWVCQQALNKKKLADRITQIKSYASEYESPRFAWSDPAVQAQTDAKATVTLQLVMSTSDEKQSQQMLTFITVHKTGWLVCDVAG